jgi:FtsH-binding integral membrane protein
MSGFQIQMELNSMGFSRIATMPQLVLSGEQRATLVRRTYTLVFASILVTMAATAFTLTQESLLIATAKHPFITMIVAFIPLMMAMSARRSPPRALALVFLFNVVMGISIAPIIYVYGRTQPGLIGQAGLLTGTTFGVLTAYTWMSRRDFSAWGSFLIVGVWVLFFAGLLNAFFGSAAGSLWIAAVGVMIFSGLLIFDTWRLKNVYGPDDYVPAAVNIYLDLLNMFMFVLQLLGGGRNRS